MGVLSFLTGFVIACWLIAEKLISIANETPYRNVTEQPLFFLALIAIVIGSQLFLTGFVAELISRSNSERNSYQIETRI
jgi:prolipoprotein diacylglyceryltransferase